MVSSKNRNGAIGDIIGGAWDALMMVHSFSQDSEWFDDYCQFLALFGVKTTEDALKDSVVYGKNVKGTRLYFGWVKGNPRFLKV